MIRALIIMPAEHQAAANLAALTFDPTGGGQTFTVPLFASGQPQTVPAAFWCCAQMSEAVFAQVQALQTTFPGCRVEAWDAQAQPSLPSQLLTECGLEKAT